MAASRSTAQEVAAANGGRLVQYREEGNDAVATVEVGVAQAVGRARREGGGGSSSPGPDREAALAPAMRAALARAEQLLGQPVPVSDGRSRGSSGLPGAEAHAQGLAVDVAPELVDRLAAVGARAGLCQPYPEAHPVHFELCPPGSGGRSNRRSVRRR